MNIATILKNSSVTFKNHPAVMLGDSVVYTYGDMYERASKLAGGLLERLQLKPGDMVALAMSNHINYFEVLFAIWQAGLVAVPINAKLHIKEMAYIIDHSDSKACFVTRDIFNDRIKNETKDLENLEQLICVDDPDYEDLFSDPIDTQYVERDDLAWLFYTSGTTGLPKGAMLSHLNLQLMTWSYICDMGPLTENDSFLLLGPQSHAAGLLALPHISKGSKNILPLSGGFDTQEVASLINKNEGVFFFASPTMLRRMVTCQHIGNAENKNIRIIIGGAAPFFASDIKAILAKFGRKFTNGYGQGECPCTISAIPQHFYNEDMSDEQIVSVGIPRSGTQLKIVSKKGKELPVGEVGEIIVQSDIVMQGYWKNPEATAQTIKNGWLYTGDMGTIDKLGYLTLKDRSKDVIISGGTNIYPSEVENLLLTHPNVVDVAVVGRKDEEWGEKVAAYIVVKPKTRVTESELNDLCLKNMARFKRPKEYIFTDSLPKNSTGKTLKTNLR